MNLRKSISWNIAGNIVPVVAAFFCIPGLISNIGNESFGTLLVVLIVIGYAGVLDLGLGRALTKSISECLRSGREAEIHTIAWTGLTVLGCIGCGVSLLGFLVVQLSILGWFPLASLHKNAQIVYLLLICLPTVFVTSGIRSLLEGVHRFDLVNQIRIPVGISNYMVPLVISCFTASLPVIVAGLAISRFLTLMIHYRVWRKSYGAYVGTRKFDPAQVASLIRFGGWVSVSSIVGQLILYADRFIVSGTVSAASFAFYATPYELSTKVWLLPTAYVGVLFPTFAQGASGENTETRRLYLRSLSIILFMLLPICLILYFMSFELLSWWISDEFAKNSHEVLSILSVGILLNSLAQVPFTLIQAVGKPKLTAKVHLATLAPYLIMLWLMVRNYGIEGAATSWTLRILLTTAVFFAIAERHFRYPAKSDQTKGSGYECIDSQSAY